MLLNNYAYLVFRTKAKDGKSPLYLRVVFDQKKKDISLKIKISDPEKFDFEKNQLKGGASVAHTNLLIQQILQKANNGANALCKED